MTRNVTLISCCSVEHDRYYLKHFFKHYLDLGVTQFHILLNYRKQTTELEEARLFSNNYPCTVYNWEGPYTSKEMMKRKHAIIASLKLPFEDWLIHVDIDEFLKPELSLETILTNLEEENANYCNGQLVDRITEDGALPNLKNINSLFQTFPLSCNLSHCLLKAKTNKTILTRENLKVGRGNHTLASRKNGRLSSLDLTLYHFKWVDTVVPKLKERIDYYRTKRYRWWKESARFINHFTKNEKIELSFLEDKQDFWLEKTDSF